MTSAQEHAFQGVLSSWRRREEARTSGDFRALAKARIELDLARARMHSSTRI